MPESSLLSVRTFIEDRRSNRNSRRRSRFLEIVGQLVVPPRYVRIEVSLADTADEWDVYPLDMQERPSSVATHEEMRMSLRPRGGGRHKWRLRRLLRRALPKQIGRWKDRKSGRNGRTGEN